MMEHVDKKYKVVLCTAARTHFSVYLLADTVESYTEGYARATIQSAAKQYVWMLAISIISNMNWTTRGV